MTKKEWLHLSALPSDIRRRTARIERLERIQAEGPCTVADTVQSSTDAGQATVLCHATVRGADPAYSERDMEISSLKRELFKLNNQYNQNYAEAVRAIEREPDPKLRCILHDVIIDGKSYSDTYGYDNTADALRKRVERWIEKQIS